MDLVTDAAAGRFSPVTDTVVRVLDRAPRTLAAYVSEHAGYWRPSLS